MTYQPVSHPAAALDEDTVEALDRVVRAGVGPSRAAVVAAAVREWLARHSEGAIAASYRRDVCIIADVPNAGRHPVVMVTRDTALPVLTTVACVLVTTKVRGHVAEVQIGQDEGLQQEGAANCDNLFTLPQATLRLSAGSGPPSCTNSTAPSP